MDKFVVISFIGLIACSPSGVDGVTKDATLYQGFEIYNAGNYSIFESCSGEGGQVSLQTDYFRFDHSVCDVESLSFSKELVSPIMNLANCRDDGGEHDSSDVTIVADEENNMTLVGWGKDPIRLYPCEAYK